MAIKVVLSKKNKVDEYGYLQIQSFNGGKKKKGLGIKISADHFEKYFNSDFNQFKKNSELAVEDINKKIADGIYRFENNLPDVDDAPVASVPIEEKKVPSEQAITNRLSFLDYFHSRIALKKTEGHKYCVLNVYRKLKKYVTHLNKDNLYFDELTPEFIVQFKNYCLSVPDPRKLSESGFRNYLKVFKSVYHDTVKTDYYRFERNPFILLEKSKADKKDKKPLDKNQVQVLMELDLNYKHNIARQMFFFQVLGNGMRCSDVLFLRYGDFKSGQLTYTMMKTNNKTSVSMGLSMMMIIAELLGENSYYKSLFDTVKIFDKKLPSKTGYTLNEIDGLINNISSQNKGYIDDGTFEHYKGHIVPVGDIKIRSLIDVKQDNIEEINKMFISHMIDIIEKQNPNDYVFLQFISKKSADYFKDYQKGDVMSAEAFQKYRNIRNIYNNRLREITDIYNALIPSKIKDRWKYEIKLSSHVARNTFVNILLKEGVDIYYISHALVHSTLKTTENYIKSGFNKDASDKATTVIDSKFLNLNYR